MQRFVLEPVLFAIFGELLYPTEPVEYYVPHSTILELYDLRDSEQIVTDPSQNEHVRQSLEAVISFFEQPFVKKKIERSLRVPWQKSSPILFSDRVTFTVVYALDNAEYGESFDPVETELILTAKQLNAPLITDQLEFQQRIIQHRIPVTVVDVADFGFLVDEPEAMGEEYEDEDLLPSSEPLAAYEAQEGAGSAPVLTLAEASGTQAAQRPDRATAGNPMLPWIFGAFAVMLVASLWVVLF
ncbi:ADP-heptose synthase [Tumebacillus lacus]|uniref:ADP-heptose synthase n=1 Tax=Tumebacillus lacus TaxID=2995335 RepID=UPI002B20C62F|nr:ADP-heptose synthase [Tumebacillus lacus]